MGMTITIPLRTVSEANQREHHMAKHRRNKRQQETVGLFLSSAGRWFVFPCRVILTRIAPRKLDSDNLAGSFKHVQDAVAKWLGVDDGSDQVAWRYEQRNGKPKEYAVSIGVDGNGIQG